MRLRVLGVLSVLCLVVVFLISGTILTSASRELTQELQINRAASLNRLAQVAFDAAGDGDTVRLQREMDTYSGLYGEGIVVRLQQARPAAPGTWTRSRSDVQDALSLARLNVSDTIPRTAGALRITFPRHLPAVRQRQPGPGRRGPGCPRRHGPAKAPRALAWRRVAALALAALLLVGAARVTGWVLRPVLRLEFRGARAGDGRDAPNGCRRRVRRSCGNSAARSRRWPGP